MSLQNVKAAIQETLKRLQGDNFEDFCSELTHENNKPLIFAAEVEKKSRVVIANLLVSRCTEPGALDRTCKALRGIGCNDEAQKLESRCKPASAESSSVTEPGPAAKKRRTVGNRGIEDPKRTKLDEKTELYLVQSNPRGICLILNNINFPDDVREGSEKDAESLAEVFSWLGFTVLMCEDQRRAQMRRVLRCFSTLRDPSELQQLDLKVWSGSEFEGFVDLQPPLKHRDAFVCCVLSHGHKGVVFGTDELPIRIKEITRTFSASNSSSLTGKPKVFLIQACQGEHDQRGAIRKPKTDAGPLVSVPDDADVLVAVATVEDCVAFRDPEEGSWFIQSLCPELRKGCSRGDDIHSILQRVNREVGEIEGDPDKPGLEKQIPEIHYTLSKKLILRPLANIGF